MPGSSPRLRVLFVCALNQWRSPTAELLYRDDPRLHVRSAGVRPESRRRVTEGDLRWADVIFVMEREHQDRIREEFRGKKLPEIRVLDVTDAHPYMHLELQKLLYAAIDPELKELLAHRYD